MLGAFLDENGLQVCGKLLEVTEVHHDAIVEQAYQEAVHMRGHFVPALAVGRARAGNAAVKNAALKRCVHLAKATN